MADFVGLLKKTIEAQSQMTPQLRLRIYERARATVERKLTESQAPVSVIERQREILSQAIDEVEAYYQQHDRDVELENSVEESPSVAQQEEKKSEGGEQKESSPKEEIVRIENEPAAQPEAFSASNVMSVAVTPPPFEEAFEREERQEEQLGKQSVSDTVSNTETQTPLAIEFPAAEPVLTSKEQVVSQDKVDRKDEIAAVDDLPKIPSSVETVSVFPPSNYSSFMDEPIEKVASGTQSQISAQTAALEIPSLAALLDTEKSDSLQESPPLSPDLPFLADETKVEALGEAPALNLGAMEKKSEDATSCLRSPLLEDYLPHWSTNEEAVAPTLTSNLNEGAHFAAADLPPFLGMDEPTHDLSSSRGRVENEVDQARRDIEALRSDQSMVGELPFSALENVSLPSADFVPPLQSFDKGKEGGEESVAEQAFQDPMSEIFLQAAKREQKQSNRKRRLAAILIGITVSAVLVAIAGVLVFTNGYLPANYQGQMSQVDETAPQSDNNENVGSGDAASTATQTSEEEPIKITKRLLPDGQESDPGSALDSARPGEGSSAANASLSAVDNSARVVFYEAPTETEAATANEGRVEWSLRRQAIVNNDTTSPSQQDNRSELAIVGDVNIPTLGVTLRLTLRRNHDETMPADYLTEIIFVVPDDFEGGAIEDIGPLLFKASEQSTGQDLAGTVTAKVRDNLFLMAVRAPQPILERNLALMRQLPWLKLNVLYKNGRVGEFSIAKGDGGNRLFQQVIDEWSRRSVNNTVPVTTSSEPSPSDSSSELTQDEP